LIKKNTLHVKIRQLPGASPLGPPPRLCPRSTWGLRAAPQFPCFYCALIHKFLDPPLYIHFRGNDMHVRMLAVQLRWESGYEEGSYGVPLYGRHINVLQFLGEQLQRISHQWSCVENNFVDMVQVYYLRNMLACFHLEE
jgi:hypothetical protein